MFSSKKLITIESVTNHELKVLVQWLYGLSMAIWAFSNSTKANNPVTQTFELIAASLKNFQQIVQYLSFHIDQVLSWNNQISTIVLSYGSSKLWQFHSSKSCRSNDTPMLVFFWLFEQIQLSKCYYHNYYGMFLFSLFLLLYCALWLNNRWYCIGLLYRRHS